MTSEPYVETERLILRLHRPEDFDDVHSIWSHEEVVRHITGKPATREESWHRFLRTVGQWRVLNYGLFLVREKATGALVGEAGLFEGRREMTPVIEGTPEAGWALHPSAFGKGYATEAMQAVLKDHAERLGGGRVVCMINPDHQASIRVAEKIGFRPWTTGAYRGATVNLYERD